MEAEEIKEEKEEPKQVITPSLSLCSLYVYID